ncbi:hypothetical protein ABT180_18280, partial [Streptomyces sp. NPDC001657]
MDTAAAASPPRTGISLRQLLMSLGEPLVELQAAPAGLDVEIRSVALLDPEDPPMARPGDGCRGSSSRCGGGSEGCRAALPPSSHPVRGP